MLPTFLLLISTPLISRPAASQEVGEAKSTDQLNAEVLSFLASAQSIRATTLRQVLLDIIASVQPAPGALAAPFQFFGGPAAGTDGLPGAFRSLVPNDLTIALQGVQPKLAVSPFASLPSCGLDMEGTMAAVNDAASNAWGDVITGGAGLHVLAYCNGTNWTVAGK